MKRTAIFLSLCLPLIASSSLQAAVVQTSVSATGAPSTNGWSNISNEFYKDSTDWALFGTGGNATYSFGGDLAIGEYVEIDFQIVGGVNGGQFVGVDFQDGGTTGIGFNFEGGTSNFGVFNNNGTSDVTEDSGVGFTNSFQTIRLTNVDGTNYSLDVGATNIANLELANGTTALDGIRVFNDTSGFGNDVAFNNLNIVPEPATFALLAGLLSLSSIAIRRRK